MNYVAWLLVTWLLLGLESPLLGSFSSQLFAPDVLVITAMFAAHRGGLLPGILTVFIIGLLKDGFCLAAPVGVFAEVGVLVFLGMRLASRHTDLRSPVSLMATAAIATLVATGLFMMFETIFHREFGSHAQALRMALPLSLITMLAAPLQFALLDRAGRLFERRSSAGSMFR
ncbi:MAG: hypothetical protein KC502_00935 [Myxococcales bacterium]|nr:hypothetical protein [Myxococcales bacterium]